MRISLFSPADPLPTPAQRQPFAAIEQRAITAELVGFRALWLADQWRRIPPRLPSALGRIRQLSVVTDGIDLGVILRLPQPTLWGDLVDELRRLDDLAGGRVRVALDLRDAEIAADAEAVGALLHQIGDALDARRAPGLPRRLSLLADPASAQVAGAYGLGLLLAPGDDLHVRRLALAHYHAARVERPGWVTRLLGVAIGADDAAVTALRRQLPPAAPLLESAPEPTLFGTAHQLIAQFTVAELADGLDEVICALAPGAERAGLAYATCQLLGQAVLPYMQAPPPRPIASNACPTDRP